jgi:X-X-X-Leu-X-X-Gly heptad repeat protein
MSAAPRVTTTHRLLAAMLVAGLALVLLAGLVVAPAPAVADEDDDEEPVQLETGSVMQPTPRTVEARLAPDGDIVAAWVRRGGDGSTGDGEEIDEDRIPIAVRVRYELDGEQVDARDLQGATGEAAVRIQLRNPTVEPRTVTVSNGDDEVEVDLSLPIVADGVLTFDDSWRDLATDAGRLAPASQGATRLSWSSALFEPFASATAYVEVRGRVEDATLPRLEVDASPVTTASNDLLRVLEQRATDLSTSDAVAAFIADNLGEGLSGAADGADGLADGLAQAREGAGEISGGLAQMQEQLGGGFEELQEGLAQLDEGLGQIAEGLQRVEEGLGEVVQGIESLGDGVGEAQQGAQRLRDQVAVPAEDAVREAWETLGERFTVGRLDPAYVDALMSIGELHALLTGELPATDGLAEPPGDGSNQEELAGLLGRIAELTGQGQQPPDGEGPGLEDMEGSDLDDYPGLAASLDELAGGLGQAADGAGELAGAVEGITEGLAGLREGIQEMRRLLDDAGPDAGGGPDGDPDELAEGLAEFENAMEMLAEGGQELAGGLVALGEGGDELLERLERDLAEANLDLATIEALSERAFESLDTSEQDAVGGHDRYLLVLHEESRSGAPIVVLAGLGMLAATLEVLRRRLTAA